METSQDSFQFPSVQLQESVNKLWDKLHEVNGTMNFLMERNIELKRKLDSDSKSDLIDSEKSDFENKIHVLELEINDYLGRIYTLETAVENLTARNELLSLIQLNYHRIISSYDKLKKYLKIGTATPMPVIIKETDSKKIAELEDIISLLRDEVSQKNKQITKSTEEILHLNNLIDDLNSRVNSESNNHNQTDYFDDKINELQVSRDLLAEESDKLRLKLDRMDYEHNSEISRLSEENERLKTDNIDLNEMNEILKSQMDKINSDISLRENQLVNQTAELMEQIDLLNEQLTNADATIRSAGKKDDYISELSQKLQEMNNEDMLKEKKIHELQLQTNENNQTIQTLMDKIEELNAVIANLSSDLLTKADSVSPQIEADLEVKEAMIKDFARNEKELVAKIQDLETELENKNKIIDNNREADIILEEKLTELENRLSEHKAIIAGISSDDNANQLEDELKHARKEIDIKSNTILTLQQQLQKLQSKLETIESSLIKTDSRISLDETIRTDLINNIESQLIKLEILIGK